MDIAVSVVREFGTTVGGIMVVVAVLAVAVRVLATRLERLYEKRIEEITNGHKAEVEAIMRGHANQIAALTTHSEKGWAMAGAFQAQAERLAERYADSTELARDMADELMDRRRSGRAGRQGRVTDR